MEFVEESGSHLMLTSEEDGLCPTDDGDSLALASKEPDEVEGVVDGGVVYPVTLVLVLRSNC